eukprot:3457544-Pyramimonas_sp.AAC.1
MEHGATDVEMDDWEQLPDSRLDPELEATLEAAVLPEFETQWLLSGCQVLTTPVLRWRLVTLRMFWHLHVSTQT